MSRSHVFVGLFFALAISTGAIDAPCKAGNLVNLTFSGTGTWSNNTSQQVSFTGTIVYDQTQSPTVAGSGEYDFVLNGAASGKTCSVSYELDGQSDVYSDQSSSCNFVITTRTGTNRKLFTLSQMASPCGNTISIKVTLPTQVVLDQTKLPPYTSLPTAPLSGCTFVITNSVSGSPQFSGTITSLVRYTP